MPAKSNQSEESNQIINNKIFLKSVREINNTDSRRASVMLPIPTATIQGVTQGGNGSRTITKVVCTISLTCRNICLFTMPDCHTYLYFYHLCAPFLLLRVRREFHINNKSSLKFKLFYTQSTLLVINNTRSRSLTHSLTHSLLTVHIVVLFQTLALHYWHFARVACTILHCTSLH